MSMENAFTNKEVEEMLSIFYRLEPGTMKSIQIYKAVESHRTCYTFGIQNKRKDWVLLFQNFKDLSSYRMNLLHQLIKKIDRPVSITYPGDGITRVGWKI